MTHLFDPYYTETSRTLQGGGRIGVGIQLCSVYTCIVLTVKDEERLNDIELLVHTESYGITQCYLPPDSERAQPNLIPAKRTGTRLTYPGWMEG